MKKIRFTTMVLLLSLSSFLVLVNLAEAQVPQKMSYQAIIRDAAGTLVRNTTVSMRITILEGTLPGTAVYTETQTPVTNSNGLVTIEIGGETGFDAIRWGNGVHYIQTETDPSGGTNYTISAVSQLLSVPYAIFAKTSSDAVKLTGDQVITGNKTFTDTINANNINVIKVAYPVSAQDAATKAYVDDVKETIYNELLNAGLNGIIKDIDGNSYKTIKIGTQVWMAENLKTTKYNDGNEIPNVADNSAWEVLTTGAYCWYNNDETSNKNIYGAHYNWYAVNTGKLCPLGWHLPSDAEWATLTTFLGGVSVAGGKMKSITGWNSPNTGATDESGFSALPGGFRSPNGTFSLIGSDTDWWSSTERTAGSTAWDRNLGYNYADFYRPDNLKENGFSVRCVRE